ncbi:MAG: DUF3293 domain-containing protein [Myxococcota bacterium]
MTKPFEIRTSASDQSVPLVVHLPHDSARVPEPWRSQIQLDDAALGRELLAMTDAHTESLFAPSSLSQGGFAFINRLSRLVFDPERFERDEQEPMAANGMGVVYKRTSNGQPLRRAEFSAAQREEILDRLFRPYAQAFEDLVARIINEHGRCLIIDGHSFPSVPLPYEDSDLDRPDLCLGFDPFHASETLVDALERIGERSGWTVGRNVPFSGSYVPLSRYRSDRRVTSIMIELKRSRYMDERTGEQRNDFDDAVQLIDALTTEVFIEVTDQPASKRPRPEAMWSSESMKLPPRSIRCSPTSPRPHGSSSLPGIRAPEWLRQQRISRLIEYSNPGSARRAILRGRGVPSSPGWEVEESFLALGVPRAVALDLGRSFGQNAVSLGAINRAGKSTRLPNRAIAGVPVDARRPSHQLSTSTILSIINSLSVDSINSEEIP